MNQRIAFVLKAVSKSFIILEIEKPWYTFMGIPLFRYVGFVLPLAFMVKLVHLFLIPIDKGFGCNPA